MADQVQLYDTAYSHFRLGARERVRIETYGEDIGQNGWLTAAEWRTWLERLRLGPGSRVLDVACGSGGPDLYLARTSGAEVIGVDINQHAVEAAHALARQQALTARARFQPVDAGRPLPLDDTSFDAIVCVDAINHLPDGRRVLADWHRLLRPGGRLLFSDPTIVTGTLSADEIAARASIGHFLFSPPGEDERLLREAGFELERRDDTTDDVARTSRRAGGTPAPGTVRSSSPTRARRRSAACSASSRSSTPSPRNAGSLATPSWPGATRRLSNNRSEERDVKGFIRTTTTGVARPGPDDRDDAAPHVPVGRYAVQVVAADFNGDGKNDPAIANLGDGDVSVRVGVGAGRFVARRCGGEFKRKRRLTLRLTAVVKDRAGTRRTVRTQLTPRLRARR